MTSPRPPRADDPVGLLTFGETMGLLTATRTGTLEYAGPFAFGIGGAESNVAIGAARLGAPVTWIGRVGRDAAGDLIARRLRAEDLRAVAVRDDAFTGLMIRHRRAAGLVHVDYHRAGSAGSRLSAADLPADLIRRASILHVTGITPALSACADAAVAHAVAVARAAGVPVSLDVNYRAKLWDHATARPRLRRLAEQADIVFAGADEARLVLGDAAPPPCSGAGTAIASGADLPAADSAAAGVVAEAAALARELAALGPAEAIVKIGPHGCAAFIDGTPLVQPAPWAPVADTVGAGDAFVAGYLAERLAGAGPGERLRTACAMGAYAVCVPGDCELLPTRTELDARTRCGDTVR